MKSLKEADFTEASRILAAANTPLFLLRKLREDPVVHEISRSFSGEEILDAFHQSVEDTPQHAFDFVRPYAYLVALALQPTDYFLKKVEQPPSYQRWSWLDYMQRVLLETYSPTFTETVRSSSTASTSTARSDNPIQIIVVS